MRNHAGYVECDAHAKLNLALNIIPERSDRGYFNVDFLNISISLHDTVRITPLRERKFLINDPVVDGGENIALKAARLVFQHYGLSGGISIDITKRIPPRSGLGGGSSDAAAVMRGIMKLHGIESSHGERIELAQNIGMDVCYCITGGLCKIGGIGNVVERVHASFFPIHLLVAVPAKKKPSTGWAYSLLREEEIGKNRGSTLHLIREMQLKNVKNIAHYLHNDFEKPVSRAFPVIRELKDLMKAHGALNSLLAGSGLGVFGIFFDEKTCRKAEKTISDLDYFCVPAHTVQNDES
jgi:4-diphosphocytidyl-2-C-methyl-D-erythritol kinase